jgi:enoyl-[acyl-carrier protein] reductase II
MIKTRMTELFGIKHPIMLAGMNWITEPRLVSAVCNAGGLGIFATARCSPEEARQNIRQIRELTDKPFGINQFLVGPGAKENIEVAIEEKVDVINYSLGKPWFIDRVHEYGGKVLGTTAIARHAVRAEQMGCDAVVITGHEAAAHGADATSLVLIPIVASQIEVPLIATGGFYDGRGLAAALALGADGISMGSRFMLTEESQVHENFKQLCLKATEQDTLYSNVFDGLPGRALKTRVTEGMMKGRFPLVEAFKGALEVKHLLNLSFWKLIGLSLQMMRAGEESSNLWMLAREAAGNRRHLKAVNEGDTKEGILFAGQACGGISDVPSVEELIERIVAGAEDVMEAVQKKRVNP